MKNQKKQKVQKLKYSLQILVEIHAMLKRFVGNRFYHLYVVMFLFMFSWFCVLLLLYCMSLLGSVTKDLHETCFSLQCDLIIMQPYYETMLFMHLKICFYTVLYIYIV